MKIIAYTFEADVHCPDCTKKAAGRLVIDHSHPYAFGFSLKDEHGIEFDLFDREGSNVAPVFDIEEHGFTHCGDCHEALL